MPGIFGWTWLVLLLAIAAYIRVQYADYFYYSPDEAMHIGMAQGRTLSEVWQFSHYETHPPLGNLLRHFWMNISDDVGFVRGESLLFGLALILLYYRIGLLLGGPSAGVACAALVAFSHGCIIQSYVARNYMFLVFFLSLGLYAYLHWRFARRPVLLLAYVACGWLAALTHFSAIFCIACIGGFEAVRMLVRKSPSQTLALWVAANAAIALVAVSVYRLWQPILAPIRDYYFTRHPLPPATLLVNTLEYPKITADYLYPGSIAAFVILCAMAACVLRPGQEGRTLRPLLALAALGFGLGMMLLLTGYYSTPGTRYSLWLLPLVVPPAGMAIAALSERALQALLPQSGELLPMILALLLLIAGYASYDLNKRFADGAEYAMPQEQWQELTRYLATLGPKDVIVTEKDDGIMLANLYRVMGDDAFTGERMATLAPYARTQILFNPYYPRHFGRDVLLATMEDAQARHLLDGADRLVFLEMAWSRSPQADLMLCDALTDKQLVAFPPLPSDHALTREDIYHTRAALLLIPKQEFLSDVLSPSGKAHGCLDGKHDMVPGFTVHPAPSAGSAR